MELSILHPLPLLDASLDSVTLSWLIGGLVASLVVIVVGVLVTGPARRRARVAALANPVETLAAVSPAPAAEAPVTPAAPAEPVAAVAPVEVAQEAPPDEVVQAPVAPEPVPPTAPVFAPESSQPATPIPVGPDFSASGPLMLPSSVVAATFSSAEAARLVTTGPLMPTADATPATEAAAAPAAFVSGPLIPPAATEPVAPAAPFVVTPAPKPSPAPTASMLSANGAAPVGRVPLPDAVDLFAHSYGRSNAAMLSATERGAASRIARALRDDPLAVQLAGMYAAETHRPLDTLAQALEADRRNRFDQSSRSQAISDAGALDVFAHSYGRSNAAMLSATERGAASRIVRALGDDPLAVRLAGMFAADTRHPLDRLANRLEADLRHVGSQNGHRRHHAG